MLRDQTNFLVIYITCGGAVGGEGGRVEKRSSSIAFSSASSLLSVCVNVSELVNSVCVPCVVPLRAYLLVKVVKILMKEGLSQDYL